MARISTYDFDGTISNTDKVIGTDSSNTTTKNFRVQDLKEFIYAGISDGLTIAANGVASVPTSNVALGSNSGNYVASITGGVGIDSTAATSGATTNHTLSLDLSELSTVTSISTGNHVAISPSNAGNLITVDNLFIKSPKLVSEVAIADGDYMLFLDGGATGDMKKESLSDISTLFAGTGLTSSSSVINLDLNSLSAKTSIVQADSLIIVDSEDSNANKKVTYAILEDEVYSNISGDVTINSSGVSAIGADKVKGTMLHTSAADTSTLELSSDTLSVLKVPNALTAGDGIASSSGSFDGSAALTFSLDLNQLTAAVIADGDFIPFIDATDNTTKKEALSDIVTLLAGDGLSASSSVLSVGVDDSTIETNSDVLRVKDAGITAAKLNVTAITGQSDLGTGFADADTIIIHDDSASALKEGTMANLASYVNTAYDLEAGLAALNASDNNIAIGHSTDVVEVIGTLKANGLTFPANSAGSNGQVLTKTSDGTIGFAAAASVAVDATSSSSHLPVVVHDESNNLFDDTGTFTYQASQGILKVPKITLPSTGVITFDDSTDFTLTHVANTGVRINTNQKLEFRDGDISISSADDGHLDLVSDTEVQVVSPIVNIDASTRVDVSGALTVGGTLTLDSVGVSAIQTSAESFADNDTSLMTSAAIDDRINSAQSMGDGFVLEDDSGDEVTITENKEVKFIGSGGLTINWTDVSNGSDSDPYDLTFTVGDITGNAATATALETSRTIHGVSFDGTGNIDLTEVIQDTVGAMVSSNTETDITVTYQDSDGTLDFVVGSISGNAATATKLATSRDFSITGDVVASSVSFDGSGNVALSTNLASNTVDSAELVDGSIDTSHIGDNQVTFDKVQDISNARMLGNNSGGTAGITQMTKSNVLAFLNVSDGAAVSSISAGDGIDVNATTGAVTVTAETASATNPGVVELATTAETTTGTDATRAVTPDGLKDGYQGSTNITTLGTISTGIWNGTAITEASLDPDIAYKPNTQTFTGVNTFSNTTEATSTTTGAVKIAGGVGIEKDLYVEEQLFIGNPPGSDSTTSRSFFSKKTGANYFELLNDESNGGKIMFGATAASDGFNALYSRNYSTTDGREFRIVQHTTTVITVATSGATTFTQDVTANNFKIPSDKKLKSEIEPIKEGLEVIKKFSSYNYIKGGEKESGFIAQEVREAIPHTVYENNEGYLSMSDRGVLAHMHKAILELDKRLEAIEEKLK